MNQNHAWEPATHRLVVGEQQTCVLCGSRRVLGIRFRSDNRAGAAHGPAKPKKRLVFTFAKHADGSCNIAGRT